MGTNSRMDKIRNRQRVKLDSSMLKDEMQGIDKAKKELELSEYLDNIGGSNYTDNVKVQRNLFYSNPLNTGMMEGFSEDDQIELAEDIRQSGLRHNLVAILDENNRYRLLSGEKRWTAICRLTEEDYQKWFPEGINTQVYACGSFVDELEEYIFMIKPNVFNYSSIPKKEHIQALVEALNKKGFENSTTITLLKSKIQKCNSTIDNYFYEMRAIPELVAMRDAGKYPNIVLSVFGSATTEEEQKKIYEHILKNYPDSRINQELARSIKNEILGETKERKPRKKRKVEVNPEDLNKDPRAVKTQNAFNRHRDTIMESLEKVQRQKFNSLSKKELDAVYDAMFELSKEVTKSCEYIKSFMKTD